VSSDVAPVVAVVGSINLDIIVGVDALPRPGETVLGGPSARALGGKGANQAAAVAQLMGRCRMVGAVGNDPDGDWLLTELARFGVDVSAVHRDEELGSGLAMIGVDRHGENSIIVSAGANAHVLSVEPGDADALIFQFEIPIETVTNAALKFSGFVAVNPSPARPVPAELIRRADLFAVNAEEYRALPELADARLVAVTLGAEGAELRKHGRVIETVEAVRVEAPANTVGAGDAFMAALTCALVSRLSYHSALRAACAVAAKAVEVPNAQPRLTRLADYLTPKEPTAWP
jgi:ribokinase